MEHKSTTSDKSTSVKFTVKKGVSRQRYWYAFYTRSRCEKKMYEFLLKQGITAYCPIRKELHKWSDRKKLVETPMVACYCFAFINMDDEKQILFDCDYFVAFVSEDRKPKPIPECEIDMMRKTVDSMLAVEVENRLLREGKRVRIMTGPMAGAVGIVEKLGDRKVNIVLSNVGITMSVKLTDDTVFETVPDDEYDED